MTQLQGAVEVELAVGIVPRSEVHQLSVDVVVSLLSELLDSLHVNLPAGTVHLPGDHGVPLLSVFKLAGMKPRKEESESGVLRAVPLEQLPIVFLPTLFCQVREVAHAELLD